MAGSFQECYRFPFEPALQTLTTEANWSSFNQIVRWCQQLAAVVGEQQAVKAASSQICHLFAAVVLLAVGQAREEVVVVEQAWPWARHCCHQRVIVAFIQASAEQVQLEPRLVIVRAKCPGCMSNRYQSWVLLMLWFSTNLLQRDLGTLTHRRFVAYSAH